MSRDPFIMISPVLGMPDSLMSPVIVIGVSACDDMLQSNSPIAVSLGAVFLKVIDSDLSVHQDGS